MKPLKSKIYGRCHICFGFRVYGFRGLGLIVGFLNSGKRSKVQAESPNRANSHEPQESKGSEIAIGERRTIDEIPISSQSTDTEN